MFSLRREANSFSAWILVAFLLCTALAQATEKTSEPGGEQLEFFSVKFFITDHRGTPVVGASVKPIALGVQGRLHYWNEKLWGETPVGQSDVSGTASMRVPVLSENQERISTVHWTVSHENFIAAPLKSGSGQRKVTCRLKRGRRIAVSVIDPSTRERVTSDLFAVLSGRAVAEHWSQMTSGILVSDGLATSRKTLRIVHLPADGPARYSKTIDLTEWQDEPRVFLKEVEVHQGTRVEGKLDDRVPRPVQQGIVSAFVVDGKNEWYDMTDVRPDGTFTLNDLPPNEVLQLTASCDQWVSADPTIAELDAVGMKDKSSRLQRSRVYPQVVRLSGDVVRPVVRMEPATTCRIEVFETGGTPIKGARVRLIPYQGSFDGRSHIFGHGENSRSRLLADAAGVPVLRRVELGIIRDVKSRFTAMTGDDGVAEIKSLPGGPDGSPAMTSFVVTHPDYFAANSGGLGDQGSSRAALYSGQTTTVTVRMKKK